MTVPTRRTTPRPPAEPTETQSTRPLVLRYAGVLVIVAAAAVIGAFFLGLYYQKGYSTPIGWDTSRYITAANLVAERGLRGVEDLTPPPTNVLSSRVGFSVTALSIASLLGVSLFKVAATLPMVAAVAVALAAGTFAATSLRWKSWEAAAAAMAVGFSPTLIRLVAPETYTENLLAGAPLVAALALVVSPAPLAGRTLAAAILLLLAGALTHGPSFAVVVGAVVFAAACLAPRSWRAWRGGEPLFRTPAGSLGLLLGGAGVLTGALLLGLLGTAPDRFRIARGALAQKFRSDLSLYRFGLTLPIAAVGAAGFWDAARGRKKPDDGATGSRASLALLLLLGWTLITLAGIAVFLAGKASPAHRFLAVLIPLPLLVGAGIVTLGRLAGRAGGRLLGVAVVVAGLAGSAVLGVHILYQQLPTNRRVLWMDPGKIRDAANAGAYLEEAGVPTTTPVVFVVEDTGPQPAAFVPLMANMIRSVLPADRIERAYMYVGDPEGYLSGEPTLRPGKNAHNGNSLRFYAAVEPVLARPHVALVLSSFNPAYGVYAQAHQDRIVAPNVLVLRGSLLEQPMGDAARPSAPRGVLQIVGMGVAVLGLLGLIGLGWAVTLLPRALRVFEVVALAPALGMATLILAGIVVDTVGFRLLGAGGIAAVILAVAAGWAAAVVRLRREGLYLFEPG